MNDENYNEQLLQKMRTEQEKYRGWLLTLPPEEILLHAYEYAIRENVFMALDFMDLPADEAKALLKSPHPLADVVKEWNKRYSYLTAEIMDTLQTRANHVIRREQKKSRNEGAR